MKILILGAGAIGGYVGGRLHQSGADVTFLVREKRNEALQRDGLVIKSTKGDVTQKVKTVTNGAEGGPYDVVVLTCVTAEGPRELAMDPSTETGFLSWMESAPPGT